MQPTQDTSGPTAPQSPDRSGVKKWAFIAGGLIVAGVVALVAWFSWTAINNRNQEETPAAEVSITADGFLPETIVVKQGTDVVWINQDAEPHTVTGDQEELGLNAPEAIDQGGSYSFIFDERGMYTYHDANKPDRKATVIVE